MKILILLICCCFVLHDCAAQKNDYVWLLGYNDHDNDTIMGTKIDFNYSPPRITNHRRNLNFLIAANSSICDDSGTLQCYTNGVNVMNNADQLMQNGYHLLNCDTAYGCYPAQGVLTLPFPGAPRKYVMLMEQYFQKPIPGAGLDTFLYVGGGFPLTYNVIDMAANSGLGNIVVRKDTLLSDTLTGHLTAVRHANGRDWWILEPRNFNIRLLAKVV